MPEIASHAIPTQIATAPKLDADNHSTHLPVLLLERRQRPSRHPLPLVSPHNYHTLSGDISSTRSKLNIIHAFIGPRNPIFPAASFPIMPSTAPGNGPMASRTGGEMSFYTPFAVDQNLTPYSNAAK